MQVITDVAAGPDGVIDIIVDPNHMIWIKLEPATAALIYAQLNGRNKLGQLVVQFHFKEGQG